MTSDIIGPFLIALLFVFAAILISTSVDAVYPPGIQSRVVRTISVDIDAEIEQQEMWK